MRIPSVLVFLAQVGPDAVPKGKAGNASCLADPPDALNHCYWNELRSFVASPLLTDARHHGDAVPCFLEAFYGRTSCLRKVRHFGVELDALGFAELHGRLICDVLCSFV